MSTTEEVNDVPIPSDTEIRKEMEVLMQAVDLGTTSTKQFISILSTKFNGADLSTKKKYIKATITEIIDSMQEEDDEFQHRLAFGEHTGISDQFFDDIHQIKNNQSLTTNQLVLDWLDAGRFTDLAWRLLGRYIANNTHLHDIKLYHCNITDEIMALLFSELSGSTSLQKLDMCMNRIGIEGIRSMVPLLQNSPNLSSLKFGLSTDINTECFELVVSSLHSGGVEDLDFINCNIEDISALETYNLPNLQYLNLNKNNIGRNGCITLSNLLQKEGSTLTRLSLEWTGLGDEEAEILANSLENNNQLQVIILNNNNITDRGCKAFLELLNNVASIESTYNSNNTLRECKLVDRLFDNEVHATKEMIRLLYSACQVNKNNHTAHAVGKAKVIGSHLNSQTLKRLCNLQGIEYSYSNIFADIEPILLPDILTLISSENGLSELYTALIQTAPDLLSYIDRKALIQDVMAKNTARAADLSDEFQSKVVEYHTEFERQMAALKAVHEGKTAALETEYSYQTSRLTTENNELSNRLSLIDLGDIKHLSAGECNRQSGKRMDGQ